MNGSDEGNLPCSKVECCVPAISVTLVLDVPSELSLLRARPEQNVLVPWLGQVLEKAL
jgi:hypothetical protein